MFFIFCQKDNSPILINDDTNIERQLIGKWKAGNIYKLEFKENNIFIDSTFTDWNSNGYELLKVVFGTYHIMDEILYFNDTQYTFIDTSKVPYTIYISYFRPQKVTFNNDDLLLRFVEVLNPVGHDGIELYGQWEYKWRANICDKTSLLGFSEGSIKFSFVFPRDSSFCSYSLEYLFDAPLAGDSAKRGFIYNYPSLQISGIWPAVVEFKNKRMYWHYEVPYQKYEKYH